MTTCIRIGSHLFMALLLWPMTKVSAQTAIPEPEAAHELELHPKADASNVAAAEALFQAARKLTRQGDFALACPKFAESNRLDPAVGTLLYLAACYEENGQTASAWATFELAASEGRKANQLEREKLARERANALQPRLSWLTISLAPNANLPGVVITRDDTALGKASFGVAMPVDPGRHAVRAEAPGYAPWSREISIADHGGRTSVEVPRLNVLPAVSSEAQGSQQSGAARPTVSETSPSADGASTVTTTQAVGIGIASAGVVALGSGIWFILDGQSKETESKKYCVPPDYTSCDRQGTTLIDEAQTQNTVGWILGGAGIVGMAGGALLFFLDSDPPRQHAARSLPALAPWVAGGGAGLRMQGRF